MPAQARIHLDAGDDPPTGDVRFADLLTGGSYLRDASEVADLGLYVDLQPWESYLFAVDRVSLRPDAPVAPVRIRKSAAATPGLGSKLQQVD